jgi:acetyltransferase-like isoleucine patch superfamily enzyme
LDDDLGTSMVLINSNKGLKFFEEIKHSILFRQVEFESILPGNIALTTSLDLPKVKRECFFQDLNKHTFFEVAEKYFPFKKELSAKGLTVQLLKNLKEILHFAQWQLKPILKFLKYNYRFNGVLKSILRSNFILVAPYCVVKLHKKANIIIKGKLKFGGKKFKKSKLESRLLVEERGILNVYGDFDFHYGADVEVLNGGVLVIKGGSGGANINSTIICSYKIVIGKGVQMGRGVTIRDNNGGHYIARQGYKDKRPVIIGDRVWLCEGCTIMPGVKIGEGAIVGAKAVVMSNIPANTIVSGNPARVVDVDVLWKY